MTRALARHREGKARVLPVLVRSVNITNAPFADLPRLPTHIGPVTTWPDQDAAWSDVADGIRRAIDDLRERRR